MQANLLQLRLIINGVACVGLFLYLGWLLVVVPNTASMFAREEERKKQISRVSDPAARSVIEEVSNESLRSSEASQFVLRRSTGALFIAGSLFAANTLLAIRERKVMEKSQAEGAVSDTERK